MNPLRTLPSSLNDSITAALADLGDGTPVREASPVGGGCIHHVLRLDTEKNRYLLKWNDGPLALTFQCEAEGLRLLRAANAIRVPEPLALGEAADGRTGFLLIEWIESPPGSRSPHMASLGEQLAAMHRTQPVGKPAAYGLDQDNYIGATPQLNGWDENWLCFFREKRLKPQMALAARNGRLPSTRRQRLERVAERLDTWLGGVERRPALLHGDLWGGNILAGPRGEPVLIDPAVYYGDREAELAFTEMFGGFSFQFYQAYRSAWPLEPGYEERRDLYNLYHLLNHLNLFGEGYGSQVDAVCREYAG